MKISETVRREVLGRPGNGRRSEEEVHRRAHLFWPRMRFWRVNVGEFTHELFEAIHSMPSCIFKGCLNNNKARLVSQLHLHCCVLGWE
jgi:hypothetical protein